MLQKDLKPRQKPSPAALMTKNEGHQVPQEVPTRMANADRFGVLASTLCAIHCALCAFVPLLFGALGVGFLLGHRAEWGFTILAILFASVALWRAFGFGHKGVALLLAVGVLGLLSSRAIETFSHEEHGEHAQEHEEHRHSDPPHSEDFYDGKSEQKHSNDKVPVGAWVGVFAGFMLTSGHALNIRRSKKS